MCKTAFTGGLLIDGTGSAAVTNSLVLIDDDKITYAGKASDIPAEYDIIDKMCIRDSIIRIQR